MKKKDIDISSHSPNIDALIRNMPIELFLEIKNYTIRAGSECNSIRFLCAQLQRYSTPITRGDHVFENLPIRIAIREDNEEFKRFSKEGMIGHLKFWDQINSEYSIIDDPAQAEGIVTITSKTFDTILSIIIKKKFLSPIIILDVLGLETNSPGPIRWDVKKKPILYITNFAYVILDQTLEKEPSNIDVVINRIDERLTQIETKIETQLQKGIRIRFF